MSGKIIRLINPRWRSFRLSIAVLTGVFLLPFLLLALLPMLIMFVPIAVVAIPLIAPVMLSGKLAAHWELQQRKGRPEAAPTIKRAPVVVR
jgi:hypothetical protein